MTPPKRVHHLFYFITQRYMKSEQAHKIGWNRVEHQFNKNLYIIPLKSLLLLHELIFFQILSLIKLKVAFLLLPIEEGQPRYLPVPRTTWTQACLLCFYAML